MAKEYKKHKGSIYKGFFPPATDLRSVKLAQNGGVPIEVRSGCLLAGAADSNGELVLSLADFSTPLNNGTTDRVLYMALSSSEDWDVDKLGKISVVRLYPGLVIETTEYDPAAGSAANYTVGSVLTAGSVGGVAGHLVAARPRLPDGTLYQRVVGRVVQRPTPNLQWGDPMDPIRTILVEVTMDVHQVSAT